MMTFSVPSPKESVQAQAPIKEVGGRILEKTGRLQLGHTGSTDFAMFESLELLVLGKHGNSVSGKHFLWFLGSTLGWKALISRPLAAGLNSNTIGLRGIGAT